jgi:hypothetical protein
VDGREGVAQVAVVLEPVRGVADGAEVDDRSLEPELLQHGGPQVDALRVRERLG